jgi:hypothetical protein
MSPVRHVKGTSLIGLVKALRTARKQRPMPPFPEGTEFLFEGTITPNTWYPHEPFHTLLQYMFKVLLREDEEKAYQAAMVAGTAMLEGPHKVLLQKGDPTATVLSMRHAWRFSFDFGELSSQLEAPGRVLFTLSGYQDVSPAHAYTIAAWGAAGAAVAGSKQARPKVIEGPWSGRTQHLRYHVMF